MKSYDGSKISTIVVLSLIYLIGLSPLLVRVTQASTEEADSVGLDYSDFNQRILQRFFDDEYEGDDHANGRVFYSHSMMVYGTEEEKKEKELIRTEFDDFGLVSPKFYEGNDGRMQNDMDRLYPEKNGMRVPEMEFYKMIVGSCQMLVYSKWEEVIPIGVAIEVNHAIDIGIPVFELVEGEFIPQKVPVDGLSYEETTNMYADD